MPKHNRVGSGRFQGVSYQEFLNQHLQSCHPTIQLMYQQQIPFLASHAASQPTGHEFGREAASADHTGADGNENSNDGVRGVRGKAVVTEAEELVVELQYLEGDRDDETNEDADENGVDGGMSGEHSAGEPSEDLDSETESKGQGTGRWRRLWGHLRERAERYSGENRVWHHAARVA